MQRSFRKHLIHVLLDAAKEDERLVVLNADSERALGLGEFTRTYPHRMINVGISEADLLSTAAGIATTGLIPVVAGFSMFVAIKPYEQIRQVIAYPNLNVKIIATHAGICVGQDGASHQAVEDMAIMRALPNFSVYAAADVDDEGAIFKTMLHTPGPSYLRLGRDIAEDVFFNPEKSNRRGGSDRLREGRDITILACGLMLEKALLAAEALEREGIFADVINCYSIKPLDEEGILASAKKTGAVVTAEDHSIIGGLGGAVAELLSRHHPVFIRMVGVMDIFGESGTQAALYEKYGLTPEHIYREAKEVLARKKAGEKNG